MKRAVIVTTEFRGVFFGYTEQEGSPETIKLTDARCAIFWESEVNGFMGLAATGPTRRSRIGPRADISLNKVTSVVDCKDEAIKAWER